MSYSVRLSIASHLLVRMSEDTTTERIFIVLLLIQSICISEADKNDFLAKNIIDSDSSYLIVSHYPHM